MENHTIANYKGQWVEIVDVHSKDFYWVMGEDGHEFIASVHSLEVQ
jgi:hypothetical protein